MSPRNYHTDDIGSDDDSSGVVHGADGADGADVAHGADGSGDLRGADALWPGDTGTLRDPSRRALLEILKGPYLSGQQNPQLWSALVADEHAIRSRLHDIFLDLVIDTVDEFAFVRKAQSGDYPAPSALRSEKLTFLDTVMLLQLRTHVLTTPSGQRTIIGKTEIYEQLQLYRGQSDEITYLRNLNAAWGRMVSRYRVIHSISKDNDRVEISPVVKFLIDEERIRALNASYVDTTMREVDDSENSDESGPGELPNDDDPGELPDNDDDPGEAPNNDESDAS